MFRYILLAFVGGAACWAGADPFAPSGGKDEAREFSVSAVGRDKTELYRVFEAVVAKESGSKGLGYVVLQRVGDGEYLIHPRKEVVHSSGMARIGGGGGVYVSYGTDYDKLYWLICDRDLADGEIVPGVEINLLDEVHSYETAAGTVRTVREAREVARPKFSKEEFVARLKEGESWTLKGFWEDDCQRCFGDGKLSPLQGEKTCPDCKGKGAVKVDALVVW